MVTQILPGLVEKANERIAVSDDLAHAEVNSAPILAKYAPVPNIVPKKRSLQILAQWLQNNLRTEAEFGTAFLFWPVWLGLGAHYYFSSVSEPRLQPLLAVCVLVFCLAVLVRNTLLPRLFFTALLIGCLGFAAAKFETMRLSTVMMGSEVTTRITGKLIHAEEITKGRTRLIIEIKSTERPKLKFAPERIRVSARGDFAKIEAGSTVRGLVRLFALPGPVKPNGYDFAFESYFDGVGAAGFFLGKPEFENNLEPKTMVERIDIARSKLTSHIRSIVPGETGAVVAALVTGVRGAVIEADNEALRRSGLAHVMSISGLHLALAAGVLIATTRLGFALIPSIANVWPVKKIAASGGILIAILYCLLSGSEVATLRSTIMIVVMLVAVLVDRPAITMRNLAIAALILIAISPHEIAGPGFQMSFAATAGLIAIYRWWARRPVAERDHQRSFILRAANRGKTVIFGTILSSTVAGLSTLPFGAFHFERLAPWGTLSNLLALPAISIVVMPSAVAAMVAVPFGLDVYIWPIMAAGVELMLWLARTIAAFGGPDATGAVPTPALIMATMSLLVICLPYTKLKWLGLVPLFIAGGFMLNRDEPAMFIDENAKLIAIVTENRDLAVSSTRPDEFIVKNWQRTALATNILKPASLAETDKSPKFESSFNCSKTLCTVRLPDGLKIVQVKAQSHIEKACKIADLVVQGYAGPPIRCSGNSAVITSGMLARHGAIALYKAPQAAQTNTSAKVAAIGWRDAPLAFVKTATNTYQIEWSYPTLNRPWQTQRIFSRPARDLAPKPKPEKRAFTGTGLQGRV